MIKLNEKKGYAESLGEMTNSTLLCIVEDISKTKDPIRKNIMNCGVNIASTAPLYGKNVSVYAIEDNVCYDKNGRKSINKCYDEIAKSKCFVMYIEKGNEFDSYSNMMIIGVNETFNEKGCEISG